MAYTVKITYEHPTEDVLLSLVYFVPEVLSAAFSDRRIKNLTVLRSSDRTYAVEFYSWESKEEYLNWSKDNYTEEFFRASEQFLSCMKDLGMIHHFYEPETEDYDWATHHSSCPDRVQYPQSVVSPLKILLPPVPKDNQ